MRTISFTIALAALSGCAAPRALVAPADPPAALMPSAAAPASFSARSLAQPMAVLPPPGASVAILPPGAFLSWNPVDDAAVTAYYVYWGTASRAYDHVQAFVGTSAAVALPDAGREYFFAVTAVDEQGDESSFSAEATYTAFMVLALTFPDPGTSLQSSPDLATWAPRDARLSAGVWRVVATNGPAEFYRTQE